MVTWKAFSLALTLTILTAVLASKLNVGLAPF